MRRTHVLLAVTTVAALCFALPAVGATSSPLKIAKQALGLSKKASKSATSARKLALSARSSANAANTKSQLALDGLKKPVASATKADTATKATTADTATKATTADTATKADSATKATTAGSADNVEVLPFKKVDISSTAANEADARSGANEVALATHGSLTIYGKCFKDSSGPTVLGEVYIRTSVNGAVFRSSLDDQDGPTLADFLNTDTGELIRQLNTQTTGNNNAYFGYPHDGQFDAVSADGETQISGEISAGVKQGVLPGGNGPYPSGDGCTFDGVVHIG